MQCGNVEGRPGPRGCVAPALHAPLHARRRDRGACATASPQVWDRANPIHRAVGVAALLAGLSWLVPIAHAQTTTLPNTAVAGGGGVLVQGDLKLSWTVGEPVAGTVSSASTRLLGGFQATFLPPGTPGHEEGRCTIFCDGFEEPLPQAKFVTPQGGRTP